MLILGLLSLLYAANDTYQDISTTLAEQKKIDECVVRYGESLSFASVRDMKECKPFTSVR